VIRSSSVRMELIARRVQYSPSSVQLVLSAQESQIILICNRRVYLAEGASIWHPVRMGQSARIVHQDMFA